jgi:hypothetical protein
MRMSVAIVLSGSRAHRVEMMDVERQDRSADRITAAITALMENKVSQIDCKRFPLYGHRRHLCFARCPTTLRSSPTPTTPASAPLDQPGRGTTTTAPP